MSEELLATLNKLEYDICDNEEFRSKNPKLLEQIVSYSKIPDIEYMINKLGYHGITTFESSDKKHTLRNSSLELLLSASRSNTVDVVKWLLGGITLSKKELTKILDQATKNNGLNNILGFVDDLMFKELMMDKQNIKLLHNLSNNRRLSHSDEMKQLIDHIGNNYPIHFIAHTNTKYGEFDYMDYFIKNMIRLRYIYFMDYTTDIHMYLKKSERDSFNFDFDSNFFRHLNEDQVLTPEIQKKLLDYVIHHNLRGYLINETIFEKLDISIIEALYMHKVYAELVKGHIPDVEYERFRGHKWNHCIGKIFIVQGITYHGDKDVIYKKLKVLESLDKLDELDNNTEKQKSVPVLSFTIDIIDKDKVVNTMINMILGLGEEDLNFNDVLGILDLYHKYDGTFIDLESLEHMIINALDSEDDQANLFNTYSEFLIQRTRLYKFRFLFNYLLLNKLYVPCESNNEVRQ